MPRLEQVIESTRDRIVARLVDGRALLVLGGITIAGCFAARPADRTWSSVRDGLAAIGDMLSGQGWLADVATDIVGFHRLAEGRDPYPQLGTALREIGIDWPINHMSTHPPTSYLLVAPIAYLPLGTAGRIWCLAGFGLLFLSFRCYGVPWRAAAGLTLMAGLWRPFAASFQNMTFVWLAGVAIAYRFREGKGLASGAGVGLASLTKLLPLGVVLYFLRSGRWRAGLGAGAVWVAVIATLAWMHPGTFSAYLAPEVRANAWATILRPDNSSMPRQAYAAGGLAGLAALAAYGIALLHRNRQALLWPARSPDYSFFLYSFLAIAFLPIAWGYSLAPLLPVLGFFALRGRAVHVVLATAVFLSLAMFRAFGPYPVLGTFGATVLFWPAPPAEGAARAWRPAVEAGGGGSK